MRRRKEAPVAAAVAEPGAARPEVRAPSEPTSRATGASTDVVARSSGTPAPRLGDLLVASGLVTGDQLETALREQKQSGQRLGAVLVRLGMLDERDLARTLAEQQGLPLVDLRQDVPEPEALARMPDSAARALSAVPIRPTADGLLVAVADSDLPDLRETLVEAVGGPVVMVIAPAGDIARAINNSYRALAGVAEHVRVFEAAGERRAVATGEARDVVADENAPVVRVVELLLTQALRDRASDVHIEPQDGQVRVRLRIDGALHEVATFPAAMAPALVSRIKIMAGMNIVERRRPQDGQIETTVDGHPLDIRVSTTSTVFGEKAVLRLLDKARSTLQLGDLGMPPETYERFRHAARHPYGMVVVAGPTGSGKTTTLYATLHEMDSPERNLMTIEDPVEYVFPTINQIPINEQAGITFATGLRSILRQDPDVILVGEVRDAETARIAVQSALTGHFVLSSVHATDAAAALHRFLDMGIEPFLIASSLLAVVAQRLVRRVCPHCRVRYEPGEDEQVFYANASGSDKSEFWRGAGCNFCAQTGYSDRIGVFEMLEITPRMRDLIVANTPHDAMRELAVTEGMRPMRAEALRLVEHDVTTISEILKGIYLV